MPITTTRGAQQGTSIKTMRAGEVFNFTSAKVAANSGLYIRIASKENKALNLQHFKVYKFEAADRGVVTDATLTAN